MDDHCKGISIAVTAVMSGSACAVFVRMLGHSNAFTQSLIRSAPCLTTLLLLAAVLWGGRTPSKLKSLGWVGVGGCVFLVTQDLAITAGFLMTKVSNVYVDFCHAPARCCASWAAFFSLSAVVVVATGRRAQGVHHQHFACVLCPDGSIRAQGSTPAANHRYGCARYNRGLGDPSGRHLVFQRSSGAGGGGASTKHNSRELHMLAQSNIVVVLCAHRPDRRFSASFARAHLTPRGVCERGADWMIVRRSQKKRDVVAATNAAAQKSLDAGEGGDGAEPNNEEHWWDEMLAIQIVAALLTAFFSVIGMLASGWSEQLSTVKGSDVPIYIAFGVYLPFVLLMFSLAPRYIATAEMGCIKMLGAFPLPCGFVSLRWRLHVRSITRPCFVRTETIVGPIWVYLYDGETPNGAAYVGGAIIITAVLGHSIATMRAAGDSAKRNADPGAAAAGTAP